MTDATYLIVDIETGPLPEADLREIYREPTYEEYAGKCDKRWKPETVAAKYEESKITGWQDFVDKAALSPLTGEVLAVGLASEVGGKLQPRILTGPEDAILMATWQAVEQAMEMDVKIIGHNCEKFDWPFLIRRSWKHGIDCPDVFRGRWLTDGLIDTQSEFLKGTGDRYVKLDVVARFLNCGGKPEESHLIEWEGIERKTTGEHFWRYFRDTPANRQIAIDYLVNDLAMTAKIAKRMQLV